jgi:hypothetical protein
MTPFIRAVQTCRWGMPTLLLSRPFWYEAADYDWACTRNDVPVLLANPDVCRTCAHWASVTTAPEHEKVRAPCA